MYAGLLTGDVARASTKTLLDPAYAALYAANLIGQLRPLDLPKGGNVLDIGCGAGAITAALGRILGCSAMGIELSPSAVSYATAKFPEATYVNRSAEDLTDIPAKSLALTHAREMYPYSRTSDVGIHLSFLAAAYPKLVSGGLFVVVQVRDPSVGAGIHHVLDEVREQARQVGYQSAGMIAMVPQRLYRRFGAFATAWPSRMLFALAAPLIERLRPGSVTYLYWFKA